MLQATQLLLGGMTQILPNGFNSTVNVYKLAFAAGSYDDEVVPTITGSFTSSGLLLPPYKGHEGSMEAMLMEQGKLLMQDKILFLDNSTTFNGSSYLIKIGGSVFSIIPQGIIKYELAGSTIYNKLFLRYQPGGSLF